MTRFSDYRSFVPRALLAWGLGLILSSAVSAQDEDKGLPQRNERDTHAVERWIGLAHDRQLLVLQSLGVRVPQDFFSCVCKAGGFGQPGTRQYYHPGVIGKPDDRYACQRPGPPCVVEGYGCTRHDLPTNRKDFEDCAALIAKEVGHGNPLDNILSALADRANRIALTENPVIMNEDRFGRPPADCNKARKEAGLRPLGTKHKAAPAEKVIWVLSPQANKKLDDLVLPARLPPDVSIEIHAVVNKIMSEIKEKAQKHIFVDADELDLRFDFDHFEVAFTTDKHGRVIVSEAVLKPYEIELTGGQSVDVDLSLDFSLSDPEAPLEEQGYTVIGGKIGIVFEGPDGEIKFGIHIDRNATSSDYYDGEWQSPSENRFIAGVENMISKLDIYGGLAWTVLEVPPGNAGVEATWKIKDRYSNWLFSDMNTALDNLLENQNEWEKKRHDYIGREAERFGIDSRCFTVNETLKLTHAAYASRKEADPDVAPPFQNITQRAAERRAKAAERAANPSPPTKPRPVAPTPPPTPYEDPMPVRVYPR